MLKYLLSIVVFALLTPGVILSIPPGSSLHVQAVTHGVAFTISMLLLSNLLFK